MFPPDLGWHMAWVGLWWLLGLAGLILLVWVVARAAGRPTQADDSPETILKRRYARSEIDREEYERRLNDLRK